MICETKIIDTLPHSQFLIDVDKLLINPSKKFDRQSSCDKTLKTIFSDNVNK